MNEKTKMFIGAFAIALIFLVLCAGFIAVDYSTGKYMPGAFGPLFMVNSITTDGADITVFSERLSFSFELDGIVSDAWLVRIRGLLPPMPFVGAKAADAATEYFAEKDA